MHCINRIRIYVCVGKFRAIIRALNAQKCVLYEWVRTYYTHWFDLGRGTISWSVNNMKIKTVFNAMSNVNDVCHANVPFPGTPACAINAIILICHSNYAIHLLQAILIILAPICVRCSYSILHISFWFYKICKHIYVNYLGPRYPAFLVERANRVWLSWMSILMRWLWEMLMWRVQISNLLKPQQLHW